MVPVTVTIRNLSRYDILITEDGPFVVGILCSTCNVLLPLESYEKNVRRWHGHQEKCIPCCRAAYWSESNNDVRERKKVRLKKHYQENKEHYKAVNKAYVVAHPEVKKRAQSNYYARNLEAIRKKKREEARAAYAKNPDKFRARAHSARAKRFNVIGDFTASEWTRKLDEYDYCCAYCHEPLEDWATHRDHIIPLIQGGTNYIENIAPACVDCNLSKQGKTPEQWEAWKEANAKAIATQRRPRIHMSYETLELRPESQSRPSNT